MTIEFYKIIHVTKKVSEVCFCGVRNKDYSSLPVFNAYIQNCLFEQTVNYIEEMKKDPTICLVIHLNELVSSFKKDLHYSFHYRKSKQLPTPNVLSTLQNINDFIDILLNEYFYAKLNDRAKPQNLLVNPLYEYETLFCINKQSISNLDKRILVIPNIT